MSLLDEFEDGRVERRKNVLRILDTRLPSPGQEWRHFKGDLYEVIGIVWDAEGDVLIPRVLYTKGQHIFSRSLQNFLFREDGEWRFTRER